MHWPILAVVNEPIPEIPDAQPGDLVRLDPRRNPSVLLVKDEQVPSAILIPLAERLLGQRVITPVSASGVVADACQLSAGGLRPPSAGQRVRLVLVE